MASMSVPCPKICAPNRVGSIASSSKQQPLKLHRISFPHAPDLGFNGSRCFNRNRSMRKRSAQINEVTTNSASIADIKTKPELLNGKVEAVESNAPDAPAIAAFMAQVSDLVKLVDSRDIVELELKQLDCEVVIRKKEALQQQVAAAAAPVYIAPPPMPQQMSPVQPAAYSNAALAAPSPSPSVSAPASAAPAKKSQSSSHPPLKCPMAGTFYRSPAPGEPPFVKVGDKVQKGQVVCIVEAMKLMNEIEADQSGTIAEILMEDGKPVSVDTPLFNIVP